MYTNRITRVQSMTVANGTQVTTRAVDGRNFGGYSIMIPASFTSTSITFTVCDTPDGTFLPLYDATGATLITVAVASSRCYDAPAELFGALYWKIATGSAETGDKTVKVLCKT